MTEREETPEQLSEFIQIDLIPRSDEFFGATNKEQAIEQFKQGSMVFKWIFSRNTLKCKIWHAQVMPFLSHDDVRSDGYSEYTYGSVTLNKGVEFRNSNDFTQTEKEAIKLALEKYFETKIKFYIPRY